MDKKTLFASCSAFSLSIATFPYDADDKRAEKPVLAVGSIKVQPHDTIENVTLQEVVIVKQLNYLNEIVYSITN